MRARIHSFEWPREIADSGWRDGCDPDFLRRFCGYWAHEYDAEAAESELNRYPQLLAEFAPNSQER